MWFENDAMCSPIVDSCETIKNFSSHLIEQWETACSLKTQACELFLKKCWHRLLNLRVTFHPPEQTWVKCCLLLTRLSPFFRRPSPAPESRTVRNEAWRPIEARQEKHLEWFTWKHFPLFFFTIFFKLISQKLENTHSLCWCENAVLWNKLLRLVLLCLRHFNLKMPTVYTRI